MKNKKTKIIILIISIIVLILILGIIIYQVKSKNNETKVIDNNIIEEKNNVEEEKNELEEYTRYYYLYSRNPLYKIKISNIEGANVYITYQSKCNTICDEIRIYKT